MNMATEGQGGGDVSDLQTFPQFSILLEGLLERLGPNGGSLKVEQELDEVKAAMQQTQRNYLQWNTLYREMRTILAEHSAQAYHQTIIGGASASVIKDIAFKKLQHLECMQYLDAPLKSLNTPADSKHPVVSNANECLLGLDPTHCLMDRHKTYEEQEILQQFLSIEVAGRLQDRCHYLASFYTPPQENGEGHEKDIAGSSFTSLAQEVDLEQRALESMRKTLRKEQDIVFKGKIQLVELLREMIVTLRTMIDDHLVFVQPRIDNAEVDWLLAKASALCLKLSKVRNQTIYETYTEISLPALAQIRIELDDRIDLAVNKKDQLERTVCSYQSVGMGFSDIIEEYRQLKMEIEEKTWQLKTLQESAQSH